MPLKKKKETSLDSQYFQPYIQLHMGFEFGSAKSKICSLATKLLSDELTMMIISVPFWPVSTKTQPSGPMQKRCAIRSDSFRA
jgi:hypothetical protein